MTIRTTGPMTENMQALVLEAYRLGRDYESEHHAQPSDLHHDRLCEWVAQETQKLVAEAMSLLEQYASAPVLLLVRSIEWPVGGEHE